MYGRLLKISYIHSIPFGFVRTNNNNILILNLLSNEYLRRLNIGTGSVLNISPDGTHINNVISGTNNRGIENSSSSIFHKWFVFRAQFESDLGYNLCRLLFLGGFQTHSSLINAIKDERLTTISGIGPSALLKIKKKLTSIGT